MVDVDQVIDKATDVGAAGGGGLAFFGWLTFNEWIGAIGVVLAVGSFGVNLWHKKAMVRMERERLEMERNRD